MVEVKPSLGGIAPPPREFYTHTWPQQHSYPIMFKAPNYLGGGAWRFYGAAFVSLTPAHPPDAPGGPLGSTAITPFWMTMVVQQLIATG